MQAFNDNHFGTVAKGLIDGRVIPLLGAGVNLFDRAADLSGAVTAANGSPDATATVIAFPGDRSLWVGTGSSPRRLKNSRTGKDGAYSISGLPAGDYLIAAVPEAAAADWQNPDFLESLTRSATRVHIDEGEKKSQNLTTARAR